MSARDFIDRGETERHVLNEMLTRHISSKVIKQGDSVVDFGANVGFHTKEFSRLVGETGKVHAFEPNPELWHNFDGIPNVRLWPYAVGSKISAETFILPIGHDQVGSIVDPRDFVGDIPVKLLTVVQVPLDYLEEATNKPISFVKMDVERYEEQAIRGSALTIIRDKPVLIFENNTAQINDLLTSMGYEISHMLRDVDASVPLPNVVAVHRGNAMQMSELLPQSHDIDAIIATAETYCH